MGCGMGTLCDLRFAICDLRLELGVEKGEGRSDGGDSTPPRGGLDMPKIKNLKFCCQNSDEEMHNREISFGC